MNAKALRPFIVILVVLVVLAGIRLGMDRKKPSIVQQTRLAALVPSGIEASAVKKLTFYATGKPAESVEIVRDGDAWQVTSLFNAPANKKKVDDFVESLLKLKGEPRATAKSDEDLSIYGLKEGEAFRVRAYTDGDAPAIDVLVGKAPDFRTVFMRKDGDMQVYVEAANLRSTAGVTGEEAGALTPEMLARGSWKDKTFRPF
ncbi:MAG: DUF4340 domain-containing protein, partial [Candidatus Competibacteraceae bacterium]|nr:DUF4340 domain-containing protein [Candidatus Competibacteraceae bacterium]